ncbi:MAG: hypothetical protein R6U32_06260, partial [Candidatus Woesearchaeota archaeon]
MQVQEKSNTLKGEELRRLSINLAGLNNGDFIKYISDLIFEMEGDTIRSSSNEEIDVDGQKRNKARLIEEGLIRFLAWIAGRQDIITDENQNKIIEEIESRLGVNKGEEEQPGENKDEIEESKETEKDAVKNSEELAEEAKETEEYIEKGSGDVEKTEKNTGEQTFVNPENLKDVKKVCETLAKHLDELKGRFDGAVKGASRLLREEYISRNVKN